VTDAEHLTALSRKVDDVAAKHIALEALFEHMTVPVYLAIIPQLALELVAGARRMEVKLPDGPMKWSRSTSMASSIASSEGCVRRLPDKVGKGACLSARSSFH
jgi:hypothetical protein